MKLRRIKTAILTSLFLLTSIASTGLPFKTVSAAGIINGTVFQDFNGNGVFDASGAAPNFAVDSGIGGVTVSVYDAAGSLRGSAVSTAGTGVYSISATGTGPYRVEFSTLPAGFFPSAHSTDSVNGGTAANSGSTVQFIPDGSTADVNLAVNRNSDYSENNPMVAIPTVSTVSGVGSTKPALVTFPYAVNGVPTMFPGGTETNWVKSADLQTLGATWGTAYQKSRKLLFDAAFLKRHVGLGPRGLDGVYTVDYTNFAAPVVGGFDLQGLPPVNGGAAIDLGAVTRTNVTGAIAAGAAGDNQLSDDESQPTRDLDAFLKVGRTGYGNIALEETQNTLWLVNLNQRALISVDVSGGALPGVVSQYPLSAATGIAACPGAGDVFRPFAVKFYNGLGYLGGVCDASVSQTTANLRAYVYSFNPTGLTGTAITYTPVANFALNYTREAADANSFSGVQIAATWRPWVTNFAQVGNQTVWAQPIVADLEFTANGNLEIGLLDRNAAQRAQANYAPVSGDTSVSNFHSAGDILHLCKVGAAYVMEGGAGCAESDDGTTPGDDPYGNYGVLGTDGPGGAGEFYYFDFFDGLNATTNAQSNHLETTTGGLVALPGAAEVMTTVYDPNRGADGNVNGIFSQGVHRYSTISGGKNAAYEITTFQSNNDLILGKGSALGEIELLSAAAPLEIGNRVWRDLDGDGIQDPNELPIAGVTVRLYDALGNLLATAVTDVNGEYYFSGATGTSSGSAVYNLNLLPNTNYSVRLDNPANYAAGGPLNSLFLTVANTSYQAGFADGSDSDGINTVNPAGSPAGTFPVINLTTGAAGANNHTYDFGFSIAPTAAAVSVGGRVLDNRWKGVAGAKVTLTTADGKQTAAATNNFGYFTFAEVEGGQTAIVTVGAKRYTFAQPSQLISTNEAVENLTFIAQ